MAPVAREEHGDQAQQRIPIAPICRPSAAEDRTTVEKNAMNGESSTSSRSGPPPVAGQALDAVRGHILSKDACRFAIRELLILRIGWLNQASTSSPSTS